MQLIFYINQERLIPKKTFVLSTDLHLLGKIQSVFLMSYNSNTGLTFILTFFFMFIGYLTQRAQIHTYLYILMQHFLVAA